MTEEYKTAALHKTPSLIGKKIRFRTLNVTRSGYTPNTLLPAGKIERFGSALASVAIFDGLQYWALGSAFFVAPGVPLTASHVHNEDSINYINSIKYMKTHPIELFFL